MSNIPPEMSPPDWIAVAAFVAIIAAIGFIIVSLFFDEEER